MKWADTRIVNKVGSCLEFVIRTSRSLMCFIKSARDEQHNDFTDVFIAVKVVCVFNASNIFVWPFRYFLCSR